MDLPFPTHTRERNSQHENEVNQKVGGIYRIQKRIQTYLQMQQLRRKGKKKHTHIEYSMITQSKV